MAIAFVILVESVVLVSVVLVVECIHITYYSSNFITLVSSGEAKLPLASCVSIDTRFYSGFRLVSIRIHSEMI